MVGFITSPIYLEHKTNNRHPERPSRITSIIRQLKRDGIFYKLKHIEPYRPSINWIREVHNNSYIQRLEMASKNKNSFLDSIDTPINSKTYEVALWAVGGVMSAIDSIMDDTINRAFCAVRPPGHHAKKNSSMGFCFFNNIAIATRYLRDKYNIKKVLILDWDVHHGNGTQDFFYDDNNVFFVSLHQDKLYPGSGLQKDIGIGKGKNYTLNCPMPSHSIDIHYLKAFDEKIIPAINSFNPDFIMISAGFDAHIDDPLGEMSLTEKGFSLMTKEILKIAKRFCNGKIVSVLEGGYNLGALSKSVSTHIKALMD